ncbi:unnamed protein product, partial [Rotaria sp. Silwood2]
KTTITPTNDASSSSIETTVEPTTYITHDTTNLPSTTILPTSLETTVESTTYVTYDTTELPSTSISPTSIETTVEPTTYITHDTTNLPSITILPTSLGTTVEPTTYITHGTTDLPSTRIPPTSLETTVESTTYVTYDTTNLPSTSISPTSIETTVEPTTYITHGTTDLPSTRIPPTSLETTVESTTYVTYDTTELPSTSILPTSIETTVEPTTYITHGTTNLPSTSIPPTSIETTVEPTTYITYVTTNLPSTSIPPTSSETTVESTTYVTYDTTELSSTSISPTSIETTVEPTTYITHDTTNLPSTTILPTSLGTTVEPTIYITHGTTDLPSTSIPPTSSETTFESTTYATYDTTEVSSTSIPPTSIETTVEPTTYITHVATNLPSTSISPTSTEITVLPSTYVTHDTSNPPSTTIWPTSMETTVEPTTYITLQTTNLPSVTILPTSIETTVEPSTYITLETITTMAPPRSSCLSRWANILSYDATYCNNVTLVPWINCSCMFRNDAQILAVDEVRNGTILNGTDLALRLTVYYASIMDCATILNEFKILTPDEVEAIVRRLNDRIVVFSPESHIVVHSINESNDTVIGASFQQNSPSQTIFNSNKSVAINSRFSSAAIFHPDSLIDATSIPTETRVITSFPYVVSSRTTTTTTVSSTTTTTTVSSTTTTTTVSSTATITTVPSTTTTTSVPSTTTTTTPSPIYYNSSSCNNSSLLPVNGSCKPIDEVQNEAFQAIRSNGSCLNASALAYYLTVYSAAIAHSNLSSNLIDYLSPEEIDEKVGCLNGDAIVFANTSFLISTPLKKGEDAVIGAWFSTEHGSGNITNSTVDERLNNTFSAAAVIQVDTLIDVRYLKLFLIGDPKNYRYVNTSMNGVLVSSVIVASLSNTTHTSGRMNISLYFRNQATKVKNISEDNFLCVYYDNKTRSWNDTGCTKPKYNSNFIRYECNCNHLTSFALLWLSPSSLDAKLSAEDIASLVFQSISIVCFLALIIHSIVTSVINPNMKLRAMNLLPVISSGSTTLLFIFFIALVLTVHTKPQLPAEQKCFTSATILMFFTYFFLIFMFCTKASIGYFNYIHFVRLFPPPSFNKLYSLLIISFIFSIILVVFAAGFYSNSSFHIISLHANKICWFEKNAIYYFLTIPACIFLLFNISVFILVTKRIVDHVRHATSRHHSYQRMKECVLLLTFSSISQGIGWLIGPFLLVFGSEIGNILSWIFIICNGLEGFWSILLYIKIREKYMSELKHEIAVIDLSKKKRLFIKKHKNINDMDNRATDDLKSAQSQLVFQSSRIDTYWLYNFPPITILDSKTSEYDA